jgi:hypothetical protein
VDDKGDDLVYERTHGDKAILNCVMPGIAQCKRIKILEDHAAV